MKFFVTIITLLFCTIQIKADTLDNKAQKDIDINAFKKLLSQQIEKDPRIKHFYTDNKDEALWFKGKIDLTPFNELLTVLSNSKEHGLPSELFKKKRIEKIVDSISKNLYPVDKLNNQLVCLEILSTKATIDYVKALKFGYINPQKLFPADYFIETIQPDTIYNTYINKLIRISPIEAITSIHPKSDIYRKLQEKLIMLEKVKDIQLKEIKGSGYKLNDKDDNIALIAERLILTGEYTPSQNDSLKNVLNINLLSAIKKFKETNLYSADDDEIGIATISALNKPLTSYYKKIQANLERYRWRRKRKVSDRRVDVNVAQFWLYAYDNAKSVLDMKVCVGTEANRTPLMEDNISYINLNPTWNVPKSITQKELYFSIKKDSDYLKKRNMTMTKNGKSVDPSTIDWNTTTPQTFNYSITQASGGGNSLGRIKFIFPNKFAVYLHDTPSRSPFERRNRAVSHGCVRLFAPIDFALYCTSNMENLLYKDRILISIDKTPESKEGKESQKKGTLKRLPDIIHLDSKIPLTLDYKTIFFKPDSTDMFYTDDVYNHDSQILSALGI